MAGRRMAPIGVLPRASIRVPCLLKGLDIGSAADGKDAEEGLFVCT